jgi:hypothetical protein
MHRMSLFSDFRSFLSVKTTDLFSLIVEIFENLGQFVRL